MEKIKGPEETARELIKKGYFQISRRFKLVARLPEGKTGRMALREVEPAAAASTPSEALCADYYLRVYAKDRLELDDKTFEVFRKERGTYSASQLDLMRDLQMELTKLRQKYPELSTMLDKWIAKLEKDIETAA